MQVKIEHSKKDNGTDIRKKDIQYGQASRPFRKPKWHAAGKQFPLTFAKQRAGGTVQANAGNCIFDLSL